MSRIERSRARAVADLADGMILATVEIAAPPERVFRALTSREIVEWWGADGVYRTTEWTGDVRPGGTWRASGVGADGKPFAVEGEYLEIDPPGRPEDTGSKRPRHPFRRGLPLRGAAHAATHRGGPMTPAMPAPVFTGQTSTRISALGEGHA